MDIDAFVAEHESEWRRLEELVRRAGRARRLTGAEADELVEVYQRTATHLSLVQSRAPDPALVSRLYHLLARGRGAISGSGGTSWTDVARFLRVDFPAAVYRSHRWIVAVAVGWLAVSFGLGWWVAAHPEVQAQLLPPAAVRQLVDHDFASYYSTYPAASFAAQVWTNNAFVTAVALVGGVLLGLPTLWALWGNAVNVGVQGGYIVAAGHGGEFFGLLLPHGMLELTAVFVAAGVGLRLGWTVVDPGERTRAQAFTEEGRAGVTIAVGLVGVLLVSGVLEAFVTPSHLPTWSRIAVGAAAWVAFVGYVAVLGRPAVAAGEYGDVAADRRADQAPVSA